MLSNERELAEIRSRIVALAERIGRLERKIMGRPLVDVFADEDAEECSQKEDDWLHKETNNVE